MFYLAGILLVLLLSGIAFLIFFLLNSRKNAYQLDLSNRLRLTQYRYQCNPHALLNQINSLASLPTRVSSSEMQTRMLDFGKRLRHALTYTDNLTSTVNEQIEQVNELISKENQTGSSDVLVEATLQSITDGWLPLPSLLLVNLTNRIVKARLADQLMHIDIQVAENNNELIISINGESFSDIKLTKGVSEELLRLQLEYFNLLSKGSFMITGYQPLKSGTSIIIKFIQPERIKNN